MSLDAAIAVHRFGLGAGLGEIEAASADPKAWLVGQLGPGDVPVPPDGGSFASGGNLLRQEQA
ncbi:MAG: hypothetical protein ACREFW_08970, partial [Rhizomicrobium sp.]